MTTLSPRLKDCQTSTSPYASTSAAVQLSSLRTKSVSTTTLSHQPCPCQQSWLTLQGRRVAAHHRAANRVARATCLPSRRRSRLKIRGFARYRWIGESSTSLTLTRLTMTSSRSMWSRTRALIRSICLISSALRHWSPKKVRIVHSRSLPRTSS